MRAIFGKLHRWAGLLTAGFLFFSGVTGAIISWDHEIDEVLNSHLFDVSSKGPAIPSIDLAKMIEQRDPRARVVYLFMTPEEGHSLWFFVMPRIDPATGKRYALDYNQIFLDPNTGAELGRRYWGAVWPVTRENFVSFLYKLHYTMHIPEFWGSDRWGMRLLGVIAIIWTIDCFVGLYLTLPARRRARAARAPQVTRQLERGFWARWAPAWTIKTSGSAYRINFDIHRAFSLWTWGVLFIIAFTAFSLNLYFEVFSPLMKMVSNYTPTPYEQRPYRDLDDPIEPKVSFADIAARAAADAKGEGGPSRSARSITARPMVSMPRPSSIRATITAPAASARRSSITTARTVVRSANGCPGSAPPPTSSCRRNSRCIRAASSGCSAAFLSRSWGWWWRRSRSPES